MNILFFIRLFLKHVWLLILMPFMLAGIVFLLTRDQPKKYVSKTTIYTGIASGSSIVSLEETKTDMFGTRTAFDNLIGIINSKKTAEEVGIRLFTSHMILEQPTPEILSKASWETLMKQVPEEVKALVVKNNFEKTYRNFIQFKEKDHKNFIYELLHFNHPHYSADKILAKLTARRVQSSDMIELIYESEDPGICYQTLVIYNEVFVNSYAEIKVNQSDAVVHYFQGELDKVKSKLDEAENELLVFNKENIIVNYSEQTKHIAAEEQYFNLEFSRIRMEHAASAAVLSVLENKLNSQQINKIKTKEITDLRKQLADIHFQISMKTQFAQMDVPYLPEDNEQVREIADLRLKAYNVKEKLKETVEQKFNLDYSTEGLKSSSILNDWLIKVIEYESTKAKLIVGEERKKELKQLLVNYAPLGANMKRLERKINVAEREYLSILHSLNLAKLKQQNIELNTNLKVADAPFFPIKPEPGKRKYLIILAFLIGFVLPAFVIIAMESLDQTIKTATRGEKFSGLEVASVFPNLNTKKKSIDLELIKTKTTERLIEKIILQSFERDNQKSNYTIGFVSNQKGEGKTMLIKMITEKMRSLGYHCRFSQTDETSRFLPGIEPTEPEVEEKNQTISDSGEPTADTETITDKNTHFHFIEIPPFMDQLMPVKLLKKTDHIYLVTRANRVWGNADKNLLKDLLKISRKPQMILNGVDILEMESLLGNLPRKRSIFRQGIKKLLTLQFSSKKSFKRRDKKYV